MRGAVSVGQDTRMQLEAAQESKMWLGILLALTLCPGLEGQENPFTINHIYMNILPGKEVQNGQNLTLQCVVDISTTSQVKPQHWLLFYKDDVLVHNVSSMKNTESYFIPQARVSHAGTYKCTVSLNNKEKTSKEYQVCVKGVSSPRVTLDKKEAIEGGVVTVNCSVPEENPQIHFIIEKLTLDAKSVKQRREKTSQNQNFMVMEFTVEEQDHVIYFQCQARIFSGTNVEISEVIKSELVTVTESFSNPRFHISPEGVITEGDELNIKCTIQVTHLAQSFPEIIIQKDKAIVAHKEHGKEATYSVMAMVEHSGNYTCKVEASRISKVSSIVVNITELFSKPKLESFTPRLDHGETLNLWCSITGAPPANFTIQKENTIVSLSQDFTKIASERDGGTYTCNASIGKVVKKSNAVQITVCEMLSKPRIFYDSSSEVIKGQTIAISCQSINGTAPINYRLLKANNTSESYGMNSNEPAVFKDKPTKDVEYQCIAKNCHSHSEMISEVLQVNVIAPVDEVKLMVLLTEEVESGKEIVLRCSVNNASSPITYRFYREKEGSPFYQTIWNDTNVIWYKEKASKEDEGQYYCTAFNRANLAKSNPQSNILNIRVFLAPWKKGLIAVVVIGVIIATLILGARVCFLKKAKAKQTPMEMARPAVPLLNSSNEKMLSDPDTEANKHYDYNEDVGNHAMKPINENKEPLTSDVEYTEVQVTSSEPYQGLETKGTETVYSEIRKTKPDVMENRYSRTEGSLDGT
ncbi:platelet endothelial cell adhesion molecule isoform X1 [Suricata suricatta]|uniref:Platelet endothelial cell adhesion molecule n=2 Tax=Suricata suricatta TaxID=37032 RepID=A0A673VUI4_SURSU|nr:platelet endothelial cell adhesion molecule isoform X1 [Suricata suricatta]XP_029782810.1 platelet endothelial cell adhesion molecule isoform X1 [Suricata suricatta]XP_029782811.1 platelet endothelial cell adhesion molecule isoform X1 [Suricata suricatta]